METDVVPPDHQLGQAANVLDGLPGAPLGEDQLVGEGELGDGEPGAVREEVEPGPGPPAAVQTDQLQPRPLPEDPGDEGVLYLHHLRVRVQQVGGLHQPGPRPGAGEVGEAAAEVRHDVVLQLLLGGAPVARHVRSV